MGCGGLVRRGSVGLRLYGYIRRPDERGERDLIAILDVWILAGVERA